MSYQIINVLGGEYDCKCCGLSGFDSADMPSHSSTCRSKVALLIAVPRKYVLVMGNKEFKQFQLEFENLFVNYSYDKITFFLLFVFLALFWNMSMV